MSTFAGTSIVEIRIYADPNNPENSIYTVALPITTLDAVVNKVTGQTLSELLDVDGEGKSNLVQSITGHIESSIASEGGAHALRFWEGSWQMWNKDKKEWKSVSFASASVVGETLVL